MKRKIKAIGILEQYSKLLLNETMIEYEELKSAIKQLEDLEHYAHFTSNLYATDKPDLFASQIENELMWNINFFGESENYIPEKRKSFAPYVDETVSPSKSYIVFCENYSPWDESEENMIRVESNEESHKLLRILEKQYGIKNNHKG